MIKNLHIFSIILTVLLFDFSLVHSNSKQKKLRIVDGDTIYLGNVKYRLHGIDAPETKQKCKRKNKDYYCGKEDTKFLKFLVKEEGRVICKKKDVDRYKRIVAVCYYNTQNLNKLMVRNGWAIAYRRYSKDYINDENYAKKNQLGIWNGDFLEPSKWRKENRK